MTDPNFQDYVDDAEDQLGGCYECQSGWKHGCCDDMCIACEEAPYCPDAYPCRLCNPDGQWAA